MLFLGSIVFPGYVYADGGNQLGYKFVPNKIMENTVGVLQVYSMADGISLDKLVATSSDSSIIQIVGIEKDAVSSTFNVKINAVGVGDTKIALAATGFSSEEIPITVYKNSEAPTQLLIKTTPSTFGTNGLTNGYLAVELANKDGIPTPAPNDFPITITTSDPKIASLDENQLVIKQGSYYAVGGFNVKQPGVVQISASSQSFQPVSSSVIVSNNAITQNQIQVYVYPQNVNAQKSSYAYAIVQLQDKSGHPVIANEDIPISTQILNSSGVQLVNTSDQQTLVQLNDALVIKKGSYWSYAPIEISSGINGKFNVNISAKGYLVSAPAQFTTSKTSALLDDKSARIDMLPMLATGGKELVGILHLQDSKGNPVIAKSDLSIQVDSSDPTTLSIPDVPMDYGSQAALVFGQVGTSPNLVTLNVVTPVTQAISPTISIPSANTDTLTADSLIPEVLSHTTFPLAVYVTHNGGISQFTNNFDVIVSPKDSIQTDTSSVSKGQGIFVTDATLLKDGTQKISVTTPAFSQTISIGGLSSKPSSISLDHPDQILSNIKNLFSMELLDAQGNPTLAEKDITIQLVSSDPSVVNVPDNVVIGKGSYFTTFEADSKKSGNAQISILTDEIPLSTFNVAVTSFTPDLKIDSNDLIDPNYHFDATVTATYNNNPIPGLAVTWTINGANIQNMDTTTDKDGKAKISLVSTDPSTINIQASVSGGSFETTSVSKQVKVNPPIQQSTTTTQVTPGNTQGGFTIMGISPIFLVIPVAAGVAVLVLKKREMLTGISEKISIADKFSGIKERMSELRQK